MFSRDDLKVHRELKVLLMKFHLGAREIISDVSGKDTSKLPRMLYRIDQACAARGPMLHLLPPDGAPKDGVCYTSCVFHHHCIIFLTWPP
jgi:hypothetical protein